MRQIANLGQRMRSKQSKKIQLHVTCIIKQQSPEKKNSDEATLALYFVQVLMHYTNGGKFRQKLLDMLHVCMAIVLDQI